VHSFITTSLTCGFQHKMVRMTFSIRSSRSSIRSVCYNSYQVIINLCSQRWIFRKQIIQNLVIFLHDLEQSLAYLNTNTCVICYSSVELCLCIEYLTSARDNRQHCHKPGSRLSWLYIRFVTNFRPLTSTQLYCLATHA